MRLIDADKLLKELEFCIANTEGIEAHKDYNFAYKRCKRFIQEQQTAYDIDKVVSKFEEIINDYVRYNPPMDDYQNGFEVGVESMADTAIEIVKDFGSNE